MAGAEILYRVAQEADLPAITIVRTSVSENHLSIEQMEERGITNTSLAASFRADAKGWVAERAGRVVRFLIADRKSQSIFALFVLPEVQVQGAGNRLLDLATDWLWDVGAERIWLTTRYGTKAASFYAGKGWVAKTIDPDWNIRYECLRPL